MDDQACRRFFLEPQQPTQRRYEALRAIFVEGLPLNEVADRLGYRPSALRSLMSRFRRQCRSGDSPPFSFATDEDVPPVSVAAKTKPDPNSRRSPTAEN